MLKYSLIFLMAITSLYSYEKGTVVGCLVKQVFLDNGDVVYTSMKNARMEYNEKHGHIIMNRVSIAYDKKIVDAYKKCNK